MSMIIQRPPGRLRPVTMIDALNDTWRAIRRHNRLIPPVAFELLPDSISACNSVDWLHTPVIKISAHLVTTGGPEVILDFLLHQAAHAIVATQDQAPVSRFHSAAYRSAASSLQLLVSQPDSETARRYGGWSVTSVPTATAEEYTAQLQVLALALKDWEPPARPKSAVQASERHGAVAVCSCDPPRRITMRGRSAAAKLTDDPVTCSVCGQPFVVL
jgi:hypothetical protein